MLVLFVTFWDCFWCATINGELTDASGNCGNLLIKKPDRKLKAASSHGHAPARTATRVAEPTMEVEEGIGNSKPAVSSLDAVEHNEDEMEDETDEVKQMFKKMCFFAIRICEGLIYGIYNMIFYNYLNKYSVR